MSEQPTKPFVEHFTTWMFAQCCAVTGRVVRELAKNKIYWTRENFLAVLGPYRPINQDVLVANIVARVLAKEDAAYEVVVAEESVPVDWWQHFKQRWFPTWALWRWPVQERTIETRIFKRARVCPHLGIESFEPHITFLSRVTEDRALPVEDEGCAGQ